MSTWLVTLQIEIPDDDACKDNPGWWDWWSLVNTNDYLVEPVRTTVLDVKGVAMSDFSLFAPSECSTCGASYGEMGHAPEPCEWLP